MSATRHRPSTALPRKSSAPLAVPPTWFRSAAPSPKLRRIKFTYATGIGGRAHPGNI
jgi:hypothetical protein